MCVHRVIKKGVLWGGSLSFCWVSQQSHIGMEKQTGWTCFKYAQTSHVILAKGGFAGRFRRAFACNVMCSVWVLEDEQNDAWVCFGHANQCFKILTGRMDVIDEWVSEHNWKCPWKLKCHQVSQLCRLLWMAMGSNPHIGLHDSVIQDRTWLCGAWLAQYWMLCSGVRTA